MKLTGNILVGASDVAGADRSLRAVEAATGQPIEPLFAIAGKVEIERAAALAWQAFDDYRATTLEQRARFLEVIADKVEAIREPLLARAAIETGLPMDRLGPEHTRTVNQLRLFAAFVRGGEWLDLRVDPAEPARQPLPKPDIRSRHIPLGPVAVFGSSNFPLAFSVAGGDTASALAAGCPVLVKGHPAHPGTGEFVARAIQQAVAECGLPEGVFSYLPGGAETGADLVRDPRVKAVGFTGSRGGGLALLALAAARPEPIPVFAEMSSVNPVFLLPQALESRAEALGEAFVASLNIGWGQLCTSPGILIGEAGPALDRFIATVQTALAKVQTGPMLTGGIRAAFQRLTGERRSHSGVETVALGGEGDGPCMVRAEVFATDAATFLADASLEGEVFGAAAVLVRCRDQAQLRDVAEHVEGQLTATLQMDAGDIEAARALLPVLERKAGRILANGWPTGVEVTHAMVHGGPYPATSDSRSTSVGTFAIRRFLRPVSYQNLPGDLLPDLLADPGDLPHLVNGKRG